MDHCHEDQRVSRDIGQRHDFNSRNVPDWLSEEYVNGFMSICQRMKAVIMGKTTYNILAPDHLPLKDDGSLVDLTHDTSMKSPQANVRFTDQSQRR
jgi:dihydrofolate reductase